MSTGCAAFAGRKVRVLVRIAGVLKAWSNPRTYTFGDFCEAGMSVDLTRNCEHVRSEGMAKYSETKLEEIRQANDIVDVIGSFVKLKRVGSSYTGLCPFHSEKTPSFSVSPSRQMYKCFGCGAAGNVITFIMEYENDSFPEAVQYLADRAGISLPKQEMGEGQKEQESLRATLLTINTKAARYYYAMLKSPDGKTGYEYLRGRGLSDGTIVRFGLGYAGQGWDRLYRYLRGQGYADTILKETGLFKITEKGVYDKFRNRVMFPIMDANSHVIGFGGRVMGDAKPKYLNSPETELFDKSRNLFGLNYAKKGKRDAFILCEGYMDVIALHQAGFTNAVASLGTAFTEQQANVIRRYTKEVLLTYDSDDAGQKAALRAIPILRDAGLHGKVVDMEPYKDPDEFIKSIGAEEYKKRLAKAQNGFLFEISMARASCDFSDPEQKTAFIHDTAKRLLVFEDKVQRDSYLEAVSAQYGIPKEDLRNLVIHYGSQISAGQGGNYSEKKPEKKKKDLGIVHSYQLLLSWLAEAPELYGPVSRLVTPGDFCEGIFQEAATMLYAQLEAGELVPAKIISHFQDLEGQNMAAEMFQTGFREKMDRAGQEKALNDLILQIKEYSINYRMRNLTDMGQLQNLVLEKKQWQSPENLHISLKDG